MEFSVQIPAGTSHAIKLLNEMKPKRFAKLSQRILQALPVDDISAIFTVEERQQLCETFDVSTVDIAAMVSACSAIWKAIAFYQPKEPALEEGLAKIKVSPSLTSTITAVWNELGRETVKRLSEITCTGLPRVKNTNWNVQLVMGSDTGPSVKKPKPQLQLQFATAKGDKLVTLSYEEAVKLYEETNKAQQIIDQLTE